MITTGVRIWKANQSLQTKADILLPEKNRQSDILVGRQQEQVNYNGTSMSTRTMVIYCTTYRLDRKYGERVEIFALAPS